MINLSEDQAKAMSEIMSWLEKVNGEREQDKYLTTRYLTFGGLAGTGKTTMIAYLLNNLPSSVNDRMVCSMALTGRAALNIKKAMQRLDVSNINKYYSTIHKFLYKPIIDEKGKIIDWSIDPSFEPRKVYLLIVDEASMINEVLFEDLMSLNIPILFVGDFGQLPPIKGKLNLMEKPQVVLTKIHRQALESPIIRLSIMARQGKFIPFKDYSDEVRKVKSVEVVEHLVINKDDFAFITDTNKKRVRLNKSALVFLNLSIYKPVIGTRVICLKNNYYTDPPIFNGQIGTVESISLDNSGFDYIAEITMEGNGKFSGCINGEIFGYEKPNINDPLFIRGLPLFDYGYAITCHKAQGSQYNRVFVFGDGFGTHDMRRRWLYTAITRAKEELYICGDKV